MTEQAMGGETEMVGKCSKEKRREMDVPWKCLSQEMN